MTSNDGSMDDILDRKKKTSSSGDKEKKSSKTRSASTRPADKAKEGKEFSSPSKGPKRGVIAARSLDDFVDSSSSRDQSPRRKMSGTKSLSDAMPRMSSQSAHGGGIKSGSKRPKNYSSSKSVGGGSMDREPRSRSRSRSKTRSRSRSKTRKKGDRAISPEMEANLEALKGKSSKGGSLSGGLDASGKSPKSRRGSSGSSGDLDASGKSLDGIKSKSKQKSSSSSVSGALSSKSGHGDRSTDKEKKTKLEKIEQLQAKNALYKEEFKRVQKDRKLLKKELETKKGEMDAMNKVLDAHVTSISSLKERLSQALQSGGKGDGSMNSYEKEIQRLEKENKKHQEELDALAVKAQNHTRELEALNSEIRDKDTEIAQIQEEVTTLRKEIRETEIEKRRLVENSGKSAELLQQMTVLEDERDRLEAELKDTVERATALVKEREDAIADLLRENEDVKNEIARRDNEKEMLLNKARGEEDFNNHDEEDEQVMQIRMELVSVSTQLEELQDRNLILEEEVEGWVKRGSQMEKELARVQDELYQAQQTLETTQAAFKEAEDRAERAMEAAADADDALEEAEEEFRIIMMETASKHKAALIEAKTKYLEQAAARADGPPTDGDQQANLLKQAITKNHSKSVARTKSWFGFEQTPHSTASTDGQPTHTADEMKTENSKMGKRLDELGDLVEEQEEEIKALKSELVQVRTTFNDTLYKNKKQMERLEHENQTYAQRVTELETQLQIQKLRAAADNEDNSSLSSHS